MMYIIYIMVYHKSTQRRTRLLGETQCESFNMSCALYVCESGPQCHFDTFLDKTLPLYCSYVYCRHRGVWKTPTCLLRVCVPSSSSNQQWYAVCSHDVLRMYMKIYPSFKHMQEDMFASLLTRRTLACLVNVLIWIGGGHRISAASHDHVSFMDAGWDRGG